MIFYWKNLINNRLNKESVPRRYARQKGPEVLEFYESYFEIEFPLPKEDMAAIPDFGPGAMENWGLVTYRQVTLIVKNHAND